MSKALYIRDVEANGICMCHMSYAVKNGKDSIPNGNVCSANSVLKDICCCFSRPVRRSNSPKVESTCTWPPPLLPFPAPFFHVHFRFPLSGQCQKEKRNLCQVRVSFVFAAPLDNKSCRTTTKTCHHSGKSWKMDGRNQNQGLLSCGIKILFPLVLLPSFIFTTSNIVKGVNMPS